MAGLILDAGALIAIDRGDVRVSAFIRMARDRGEPVIVPAPVLAQVFRGDRNAELNRFLWLTVVYPLFERHAYAAGRLLARANRADVDVVDASVVVMAQMERSAILTGDAGDIRHLAQMAPGVGAIVDLNALPKP